MSQEGIYVKNADPPVLRLTNLRFVFKDMYKCRDTDWSTV